MVLSLIAIRSICEGRRAAGLPRPVCSRISSVWPLDAAITPDHRRPRSEALTLFSALKTYASTAIRWQCGRQFGGDDKMLLLTAAWPLRFDSYLIHYPVGARIAAHTDPVKAGRHYLLNVVLKVSSSGGEFICPSAMFSSRRIKLFWPALSEHSVTRVLGGIRYVLSIGWVLCGRASS